MNLINCFVSPQNSYVEALIPHIMVFGGGVCEGIRFRWGHEGEASKMGLVSIWEDALCYVRTAKKAATRELSSDT